MNVVFATHSASVAEPIGHLINGTIDIAHRFALGRRRPKFTQRQRSMNGAAPSSKILCANVVAADLTQVTVDVVRGDRLALAITVHVLE